MANNIGTLVIAPVRPQAPEDTYPSVHADEIKGGCYQVGTLTDRDSIPTPRRVHGMLCFVQALNKYYKLEADLITWTEFSTGGITEHPDLNKLDYDRAGHTGFQRALIWDAAYDAYLILRE